MAVEKLFNLCQFISCEEKVILPPKNESQYLTFDQCSKTCRILESELLSKHHLMTMTLVQTKPVDVLRRLQSLISHRILTKSDIRDMNFANLVKLMNDIDLRESIYKKYGTGSNEIKARIHQDYESPTSKNDKEVNRQLRFLTIRYFKTLFYHIIYFISYESKFLSLILFQEVK